MNYNTTWVFSFLFISSICPCNRSIVLALRAFSVVHWRYFRVALSDSVRTIAEFLQLFIFAFPARGGKPMHAWSVSGLLAWFPFYISFFTQVRWKTNWRMNDDLKANRRIRLALNLNNFVVFEFHWNRKDRALLSAPFSVTLLGGILKWRLHWMGAPKMNNKTRGTK